MSTSIDLRVHDTTVFKKKNKQQFLRDCYYDNQLFRNHEFIIIIIIKNVKVCSSNILKAGDKIYILQNLSSQMIASSLIEDNGFTTQRKNRCNNFTKGVSGLLHRKTLYLLFEPVLITFFYRYKFKFTLEFNYMHNIQFLWVNLI